MIRAFSHSLVLAATLGLITLFACKRSVPQVAAISAQETMGELRNDFAVLLDVREESEVRDGMAVGATWMASSKIQANDPEWQRWLEKNPKDKKIIVYCAAGVRAGKIAAKLAEQGYKTANMGGYEDWVAAGLPTRKP